MTSQNRSAGSTKYTIIIQVKMTVPAYGTFIIFTVKNALVITDWD